MARVCFPASHHAILGKRLTGHLNCTEGTARRLTPAGFLASCDLGHSCDRESRLLLIHWFTELYFASAPSGHTLGVFADAVLNRDRHRNRQAERSQSKSGLTSAPFGAMLRGVADWAEG